MNFDPSHDSALEQALSAFVAEQGARLWSQPAEAATLLRARLAAHPYRAELLAEVLEDGIAAQIAAFPQRDTMREAQFAQQLVFAHMLTDSDARSAVDLWARVLCERAAAPGAPAPAAAAVPAPQPAPAPAPAAAPAPQPWPQPAPQQWGPPPQPWAPPVRPPRQRSRGGGAPVVRIIIGMFILFAVVNGLSQCSSSDIAPTDTPQDTSATVTGVPGTAMDDTPQARFAVDALGYQSALAAESRDAVMGLAAAPTPLRTFVTAWASAPAHSDALWLVITDARSRDGYAVLQPDGKGSFVLRFAVVHDAAGTYSVSGPLASQVPAF